MIYRIAFVVLWVMCVGLAVGGVLSWWFAAAPLVVVAAVLVGCLIALTALGSPAGYSGGDRRGS